MNDNRISLFYIVILILAIMVIISMVIWIQSEYDKNDKFNENIYILVWRDDFTSDNKYPLRSVSPVNCHVWTRQKSIKPEKSILSYWSESHNIITNSNETQFYTTKKKNSYIQDGKLIIRIIPEETSIVTKANSANIKLVDIYRFTSAKLISRAAFTYGFFIIKVKLPNYVDYTSAVSLIPYRNVAMNKIGSTYGKWPSCGQIDIFRTFGNYICGSIYYNKDSLFRMSPVYPYNILCKRENNRWYTFGLEWTPNYISWYINADINRYGKIYGDKLLTVSKEVFNNDKNPFDQPFHLVINLASQSSNKYNQDEMTIDYIRVYQQPKNYKYSYTSISK